MRKSAWWLKVILGTVITLTGIILTFAVSLSYNNDLHHQVHRAAQPYAFDFVSWELHALPSALWDMLFGQNVDDQETALICDIKNILKDEGIRELPPLSFRLEEPLHLLIVSPRERIMYFDRVVLRQNLSAEEIDKLESSVDGLGTSSLVVELGGFAGIYPAQVANNGNLRWTINTAVEEWLHHYLAFRPLGFRYLLDSIGIRQDPDIITMNETLASIVSKEIGAQVYAMYYQKQEENQTGAASSGFDFDAEMRETRRNVDHYLSQGRIETAERYMEERRQMFVARGYYIRKLNQAYFAFHGIYGQDPASVSPIDTDLKELRERSESLSRFLNEVAGMTSYAELKETLRQ